MTGSSDKRNEARNSPAGRRFRFSVAMRLTVTLSATAALAAALAMATLAALIAGCVPVWRALREAPALALHGE